MLMRSVYSRRLISALLPLLLTSFAFGDSASTKTTSPMLAQCELSNTQAASTLGNKAVSVAIRHSPPFIYEEVDSYTQKVILKGIAVDFWEAIAERLDIHYQYVCLSLSQTLNALENSTVDIAISPLTITQDREKLFDFSHQYFTSGLVFASTPSEANFDFK